MRTSRDGCRSNQPDRARGCWDQSGVPHWSVAAKRGASRKVCLFCLLWLPDSGRPIRPAWEMPEFWLLWLDIPLYTYLVDGELLCFRWRWKSLLLVWFIFLSLQYTLAQTAHSFLVAETTPYRQSDTAAYCKKRQRQTAPTS